MKASASPFPEKGPGKKWIIGGLIVLLVIGSAAFLAATFWSSLFPGRLVHPNCSNLAPSSTPSTPGNHTVLLYCSATSEAAFVSLTWAGRTIPPTETVPTFNLPAGYLDLVLVPWVSSECLSGSGGDEPLKSGDPVILVSAPSWYHCTIINMDGLPSSTLEPFSITWSPGKWVSLPGPSQGFRMTADSTSITILTGSSGTVRVTVTSFGGHSDTIEFVVDVNPDEENGPTVLFDPNIITLAADGSNSTEMTIFVSVNTPAKTFYVTVLGSGEGYLNSAPQIEIIVRTT